MRSNCSQLEPYRTDATERYLLAILVATRIGYDVRSLFKAAFDPEGLLVLVLASETQMHSD